MPETLEKLRPDRDLQCYFERPSAIAAMSGASESGFRVSGTWRQQFDWCVVEWNRDNVFEHPAFRNLPDGDLSGLLLTYEETRTNCVPIDSDLFPSIDWPYLRIWADDGTGEQLYKVSLKGHATAIEGSYVPAAVEFELKGTPSSGDYVGLAWLAEHHTHQLYGTDTLESTLDAIAASVNAFSGTTRASRNGSRIRLVYAGQGQTLENSTTGANGNRLGAYGQVQGAGTEYWEPAWAKFSGGVSPQKWRISLDFANLYDTEGRRVPTGAVRKMRWTYAADLQSGAFARSEFEVAISNWSVTGSGRVYQVSGKGSRRIEDDSSKVSYAGAWQKGRGNFSGSSIHWTREPGAQARIEYEAPADHRLYLGTRFTPSGAMVEVSVDGVPRKTVDLRIPGEDCLARVRIGEFGPGPHVVEARHAGSANTDFYFDFAEASVPNSGLPEQQIHSKVTLATDWDTDHSIALPAERTAWMLESLGFQGRANHYVGALWFYELVRQGHQYASVTIDFTGSPQPSQISRITIGRVNDPIQTPIEHLNLYGDTAESIAKAFELEINRGYPGIRAEADGARLTIWARAMGQAGNEITVSTSPTAGEFQLAASSQVFTGGADGAWRTDLAATPRINRAARDWSRAFYAKLKSYGIDVAAAFSMELQHGDPSPAAGIAQRYPNGEAVLLTTPALQTNFSPTSQDYWKQVYLEMAGLQSEAGHRPYLQFGEVQWWYFPLAGSGMPFYDEYTRQTFLAAHQREMQVIPTRESDPALYPEEVQFLPTLIGQFTQSVMSHVRGTHPNCRFEVLYPVDVNDSALNRQINYPSAAWTPSVLDNLKTESFTYTYARNLNLSRTTVEFGHALGFTPGQRSFLVGISEAQTPWLKEMGTALSQPMESVVLFALDQFCLVGYGLPLRRGLRRSARLG